MPDSQGRSLRWAVPLALAALLGVALWLLHHELLTLNYADVRQSVEVISNFQLLQALALTVLSYWILTGYDSLSLHYLGQRLPYRQRALASFLGYVFSHNLGLSVFGGAAPRYRLYSAWGLSSLEIATLIGFSGLTFWLGGLTLAAAALWMEPDAITESLRLSVAYAWPIAAMLTVLVVAYMVASLRSRPLEIRGWTFPMPSPRIATSQVLLSTVDWAVAAAVLYVLLPEPRAVSYAHFLGVFVVAQLLGVLSHVPGGLGIFETVVLVSVGGEVGHAPVVGSLLVFRVIYYLLPLAVGVGLLAVYEVAQRRRHIRTLTNVFGRWVPDVAPGLMAALTFASGVILLWSGATPAIPGRLSWARALIPLPIMEVSHFAGSLVGLGLLVLASGLQRRLDAAYHLTVVLLVAGSLFSLLKALDYEEAMVLGFMAFALVSCRDQFYRRASLFGGRFSAGWSTAVVVVVLGSIWLGFFAYKHVEYSHELWWRFSVLDDAPRFLRASVGVVTACLFFAVAHLLSPAPARTNLPDAATLDRVRDIVRGSPTVLSNLALLRDKSFVFSTGGNAFIMYAVSGRSWVAMGDPVGPAAEHAELIWRFYDLCDRHGAWPVFYEASADKLPLYLDLGLTPFKFGEEARVRLQEFSLEGSERKEHRKIVRHVEASGCQFEWVPQEAVPAKLPELAAVSEAWLRSRNTREKGFSLGRFDPAYLSEFPMAVVRLAGETVAFANVWCGADREEVAPDLMRFRPDTPRGVMDYLFLQLILWAQREQYRWFNLGMVPLSGLERRAGAPFWQRLGSFAYQHGEHFYNFQGLRQYKEKFVPEWVPRYLACPGRLILPRVLANVAALVSGGVGGVITK